MGCRLATTPFLNEDQWDDPRHSCRIDIYEAKTRFYRINKRLPNVLRITAAQRLQILACPFFRGIIPGNATLLEPDCLLMRMKIKIVTDDPGVSWEPPLGS